MESIRNELQTLRNQVVKNSAQSASQNFNRAASGRHGGAPCANQTDWTSFRNALPSLTNPCRVRKLTQFFGDEPPLIRIFLKKLGYEVCIQSNYPLIKLLGCFDERYNYVHIEIRFSI